MQAHFIHQLKEVIQQGCFSEDEKQFCLSMDEMKVKGGLAFSKTSGKLVGFCDLGAVNNEMDETIYAPTCLEIMTN